MQTADTIFSTLGYEVLSCTDGVYRLMAKDGIGQFVAILVAKNQLTPDAQEVSLSIQGMEPGMPVDSVVQHWRNIDARYIGGPGITTIAVTLAAGSVAMPEQQIALTFVRPSGETIRHATRLRTGDVVCYN